MWWCSLVALCAEEELQVSWGGLEAAGRTHCSSVATGGCLVAGGRVLIGTNLQIFQLLDVASILEGLQLRHFGYYRP